MSSVHKAARPSPFDPDTEFELPRWSTTAADHTAGQPMGLIICVECGQAAVHIDHIPHAPDCRFGVPRRR